MGRKYAKIRLALPIGSLNHPKRGNTCEIFQRAGYAIRGYDPGLESPKPAIADHPEIELSVGRPQDFPRMLAKGQYDIAIMGEDWFREVQNPGVKKIGDLGYGNVTIVAAVITSAPYRSLGEFFSKNQKGVECYTEYPNLTKRWFMSEREYKRAFGRAAPVIEMHGYETSGRNKKIRIIETAGQTEGFVRRADQIMVDNIQTGETLKKHRLKVLATLMESQAGLYKGPTCTDDKERKAEEIFKMLRGAAVAKSYYDVWFNTRSDATKNIIEYLEKERLCIAEPTIIPPQVGQKYASVHILAPKDRWANCAPRLWKLGAEGIVVTQPTQVI
ncbi:MAG: ATP phosphoribosyltransferase [Candidatus Aenigmatarchaeota archaeon]